MKTLQPTGLRGVLLKFLKGPLQYSHTKIFGLAVAWQSKLMMSLAWGSRRSQRYGGTAALMAATIERK